MRNTRLRVAIAVLGGLALAAAALWYALLPRRVNDGLPPWQAEILRQALDVDGMPREFLYYAPARTENGSHPALMMAACESGMLRAGGSC